MPLTFTRSKPRHGPPSSSASSASTIHPLVPPRYPTPSSSTRRRSPPHNPTFKLPPIPEEQSSASPSASPCTSSESLEASSTNLAAVAALEHSSPNPALPNHTPGKAALEAALDALETKPHVNASHAQSISNCTLLRSSSTCESLTSVSNSPSLEWPRRTMRSPTNRLAPDGKMRAAYVPRHGPPSVFRLGWLDQPTKDDLKPGQALVRIHAAGVNVVDCKLRSGVLRRLLPIPFPAVLGTDFAGLVLHVKHPRDGRCDIKNGDSVYGQVDLSAGFGAYAEWAIVSLRHIAKMPSNVTYSQAAALPTISLAAHAALSAYAKLKPGDKVLVFGGTSGTGHAALQLAVALGAGEVSATCSARNAAFCEKLGANKTFDYHEMTPEQIVKDSKPDIVIDTSGTAAHWNAVQAHAPGARFVVASGSECLGALAFAAGVGYLDVLDGVARAAGRKAISRIRRGGYDLVMPCALDVPLQTITPFVERGQLMPSIFKQYSLGGITKAHELTEKKKPRGKVVINIAEKCAP